MLVYGKDPQRALTLIDSAFIVGNIDDFEADYLRAKVYAHSPADPRNDEAIRNERLYSNPNLQRQDILDRFGISRRTLSDLMSAYADGQSFTAYVNAMRLYDAVHLLKNESELSLTEIAEKVGFTPATLRDQFKRQFGMTPTEYRQNLPSDGI